MKRTLIFQLILCGLICVASTLCIRAERLPIKLYTSADGLGSSFVTFLMRDSRGFLWLCTRDGLSRFDGSRFVTYQVGDKSGPTGIERILETGKGIYWISTTSGLYRYDPNAPLAAAETKSADKRVLNAEFVGSNLMSLYEDHHGNLWAGGNGLYRLEENGHQLTPQKIDLNLPLKRTGQLVVA